MLFALAASYSANGLSAVIVIMILGALVAGLAFVVLLPALVAASIARKRAEQFKRNLDSTTIAQYDPPADLSPAEIGMLYDLKCGTKEIIGTLLHLAERKIIAFTAVDAVVVIDMPAYQGLQPYEQIAAQLFDSTQPEIVTRYRQLQVETPSGAVETSVALPKVAAELQFTAAVQAALNSKGYHIRGYTRTFAQRVLLLTLLLGCWPLLLAFGQRNFNAFDALIISFTIGIFLVPGYLIFAYLIIKLWTVVAGRTWLYNKQIRAIWPELEGYRLFLAEVDYADGRAMAADSRITRTLPYAVVLNLKTDWQHIVTGQLGS